MITVLTATYNRAYILPELYRSLIQQTVKDFCWLVIDDGSIDSTEELIHNCQMQDNGFKILYYKIRNGGKHRAINFAMKYIDTEYTFIVDSDDRLVPQAIEKIENWLFTIKDDLTFAGVAGLRGYDEMHMIGTYPKYVKKGDYIDAINSKRRKYKLCGDKAEVYRTELLKKYPFPEFEGEKFLPEIVVWNQIGFDGYKIRWFNDIIYLGEYLPDGLSKRLEKLQRDNIQGYFAGIKSDMETEGFYKYRVLGRCLQYTNRNNISLNEVTDRLGGVKQYQVILGYGMMILQTILDSCRSVRRRGIKKRGNL